MKVLFAFGTRPEAIKMCPLILELQKRNEFDVLVCLTGQHREMLSQVMETFDIKEDFNLNIMSPHQSLTSITIRILEKMDEVFDKASPDMVLVHGDTSTSFAVALAAFYKKIPVGHVEAGLRSDNIYSPFPEEMNRQLTDRISTYHFAPTKQNEKRLYEEGINNVFVTGNTIIDSFQYTVKSNYVYKYNALNKIAMENKRIILVTAHRRENWGKPFSNICEAIRKIAATNKDIVFVFPVHMNPMLQNVAKIILGNVENVILTDPLDVMDMHNLMAKSYLILTDSGGLQEEGPHFGIPVLVLRNETERQEAIEAGTVKLIGTNCDDICKEVNLMLNDQRIYGKMAQAINPYGDGMASKRIAEILIDMFA